MITFMSDVLCVTDRGACRGVFLERIEALAACGPRGILLREKDLPEQDYRILAEQVLEICGRYGTRCILHGFPKTALALRADAFHGPLPVLRSMSGAERERFAVLGASCHSVEDAREAEALGCTYLTAGHIFATDCKMGVPPRGLAFLRSVCAAATLPVYAIGGISAGNFAAVRRCGAAGACVMSGAMTCEDPAEYLNAFETGEGADDL